MILALLAAADYGRSAIMTGARLTPPTCLATAAPVRIALQRFEDLRAFIGLGNHFEIRAQGGCDKRQGPGVLCSAARRTFVSNVYEDNFRTLV